jgi:hypothetical protein
MRENENRRCDWQHCFIGDGSGILSESCDNCTKRIDALKCDLYELIPNDILVAKKRCFHHSALEWVAEFIPVERIK